MLKYTSIMTTRNEKGPSSGKDEGSHDYSAEIGTEMPQGEEGLQDEVNRLRGVLEDYLRERETWERDREDLEDEVEQLQSDLDVYRSDAKGTKAQTAAERYLQTEKAKLEREIEYMAKDMDKLKDSLEKERTNHQKVKQELRDEKTLSADLEKEMEIYKKEALDFRKQLGGYQQQLVSQEEGDKDARVKL
eukprot:TRINITY_DN15271_c0_g1_i1.p1 TRINITY_DN15271_c0_g1~~TRINITY_DN15271_c0_g1_i1.p1  ORF type:complete len:190 (-),score=53.57 TRINITY_DN15271_c0_g1_i1:14-583(-)